MKRSRFPKGWDEDRVRRLSTFYEAQTEEEAVAGDEAGVDGQSVISVSVGIEFDFRGGGGLSVPIGEDHIFKRQSIENITQTGEISQNSGRLFKLRCIFWEA